MKTPRKPHPVFLTDLPASPENVISASTDPEAFAHGMKDLAADLAPSGVRDRIYANLQHIKRNAEKILSAKGIGGPRYVTIGTATSGKVTPQEYQRAELFRAKGSIVAFDWQVDEQAKMATKAHAVAMIALHHLTLADYLRTADCALVAASELRKAIAHHFVVSTQANRERMHETSKRFDAVREAGIRFEALHKRWPKMRRTADREWMNADLSRHGSTIFRTDDAFRIWKTKRRITLPW
jgi:hypothetical protein